MKTIELSTKGQFTNYLTAITEKEKDTILEAKEKNNLEELDIILGIYGKGIIALGETSTVKTSSLVDYIGYFKGPDTDSKTPVGHSRPIHYRNYNITKEKQEEGCWLINCCVDVRSSITTALNQINEEYCVLWKVLTNTSFKQEIDELLKSKDGTQETIS